MTPEPGKREATHAAEGALRRLRSWTGWLLLAMGLLGHLLAARAIGGSRVAYLHHVGGFVLILVVTGAIIAALGARFWRGRHDVTLLAIGAVQALLGFVVYLGRYRV